MLLRVNTVVPHTTNTEGVQAFAATLPPEYVEEVAAVNMPKLIPRLLTFSAADSDKRLVRLLQCTDLEMRV